MTHSFQDMSLDFFECNPFYTIGRDWFALTAQKPDGKVNTMTAGWGGFGMMWGKPCSFVVVRDSRYTMEFLDEADRFSMTFFEGKSGHMMLKYIGSVSGRDEDKIKNARLKVDYYEDVPYLDDGKIIFICRKMFKGPLDPEDFTDIGIDSEFYKDKDYHKLYIAEVERFMAR